MNPALDAGTTIYYVVALVAAGGGLWLMLPRGNRGGRGLGMLLAAIGGGAIAAELPVIGDWVRQSTFVFLAALTVVSAVGTITSRAPVYAAIWFALTLLGVGGLLLMQGAQFVGIATVAVYAGAILVTFLFVLMLANPQGEDSYDRVSWDAPGAVIAGSLLVALMTMNVVAVFDSPEAEISAVPQVGVDPVTGEPTPQREMNLAAGVLATEHVAHLGRELFGRYLLAILAVGLLLLMALVGAVAIAAHGHQAGLTRQEPGARQ